MPSMQEDPDAHIRLAAFSRLDALTRLYGPSLSWQVLSYGFTVGTTQILFATTVEGIFKPKQMSGILSIKTVVPKPGGKIWYADQFRDERIASSDSVMQYSFKGNDPEDLKNRGLRDAMLKKLPLIYFYGVKPGAYLPLYPVYIIEWNPKTLSCSVGFDSEQMQSVLERDLSSIERSYTMVQAKHRIHQALFRERVIEAYNGRCALTGLPSLKLVDAAHIIPDRNEDLGQPDIRNGICMTKIHHAAFDGNLIGIDPNYRIHVAESLLSLHDGPMLEQGLKALQGKKIRLPQIEKLWPDRDRLDHRFKEFLRNS